MNILKTHETIVAAGTYHSMCSWTGSKFFPILCFAVEYKPGIDWINQRKMADDFQFP